LRSDKGMEWVPQQMWLTYLRIGEQTSRLRYDLAIDKSGTGTPSPVMAGLQPPPTPTTTTTAAPPTTAPPAAGVALPPALPAGHDDPGPSAAVLIGSAAGGALLFGLGAWTLQSRLRRRAARP